MTDVAFADFGGAAACAAAGRGGRELRGVRLWSRALDDDDDLVAWPWEAASVGVLPDSSQSCPLSGQ